MPPREPCPPGGQLIRDSHNECYDGARRRAIYGGLAAMDGPLCRRAVLGFESRSIAAPAANAGVLYQRSANLAARRVPVREAPCGNLAGYLAQHPAGR